MADLNRKGDLDVKIVDGAVGSTTKATVTSANALVTDHVHNQNRTNVWQRYVLNTTTTTAAQVIGTYTITNGETISVTNLSFSGERATPVTTNEILGTVSFQYTTNGSTWTTTYSVVIRSGITGISSNTLSIQFDPDSLKVLGNGTIAFRAIVTPADTTSTNWQFVLIGFEYS